MIDITPPYEVLKLLLFPAYSSKYFSRADYTVGGLIYLAPQLSGLESRYNI